MDPEVTLYYGPLTAEQIADLVAKAKAAFSAADLQKYTELEEGIPFEQVIKELEEIDCNAGSE